MGNSLRRPAASGTSGADQRHSASASSNGLAQAFLQGIELDIYVGAFEVTGYDSEDKLQRLTQWDLNTIERQSHVPILPSHRAKILDASRLYVAATQPAEAVTQVESETTVASLDYVNHSNTPAASDSADNPAAVVKITNSSTTNSAQHPSRSKLRKPFAALGSRGLIPTSKEKQQQAQRQQIWVQPVPEDADPTPQASNTTEAARREATGLQYSAASASPSSSSAPTTALGSLSFKRLFTSHATQPAAQQQQQQPVPADFPSLLPDDSLQPTATEVTADPAPAVAVECKDSHALVTQQQDEQATEGGVSDTQQLAAGTATAVAFTAGFLPSRFKLSKKARRVPVVAQQQPAVVEQMSQSLTTAEAAEGAAPIGDADAVEVGSVAAGTVYVDNEAECVEDAAGGSAQVPATTVAEATPAIFTDAATAAPGGLFQSFKRVCSRSKKTAGDDQAIIAQQQQSQQARQPDAEVESSPIAADGEKSSWEDNAGGLAAAAAAVSSSVSQPAAPAVAGSIVSAALADQLPPAGPAGPLTVHRTALNHRSISSRLPPMGQKRKVPTAWAELSSEVTRMAYAVTAPLAVQPLPAPRPDEMLTPTGAWAGLPNQVDTLSYAATAPLSPKPLQEAAEQQDGAAAATRGGAWAELATEVSRMSYAATVLSAAQASKGPTQQQQQQRGARVSYAALQARFTSDPGCMQPQPQHHQQQQQPLSARAAPAAANISACWTPAVTAGLPPSAQQLHEQLLARLKSQGPRHAAAAGSSGLPGSPSVIRWTNSSDKPVGAQLVQEASRGSPAGAVPAVTATAAVCAENSSADTSAVGPMISHLGATTCKKQIASHSNSSSRRNSRYDATGPAALGAAAEHMGGTWGSDTSVCKQGIPVALTAEAFHPTGHLSGLSGHYSSNTTAREDSRAAVAPDNPAVPGTTGVGGSSTEAPAVGSTNGLASTATVAPGSTALLSSTAGSVISESSVSSRLGSGCRASDVRSIVHKAKQRAAARQRLPMLMSPEGQQQPVADSPKAAAAAAGAAALLRQQQQSVEAILNLQQQQSAVAAKEAGLQQLPGQCSSLSAGTGSSIITAAAAAGHSIDGDRAMCMLQDYRTISELDRKIKARVSQLTTPRQSMDAGSTSAGITVPAVGGNSSAGHAVGAQQQGRQHSAAAALGSAATNVTCKPTYHPADLRQVNHVHTTDAAASSVADGTVAVGLLGITEALDNSFDAGKPCRASIAAAAAARPAAAGHHSSAQQAAATRNSSRPRGYNPNHYNNPFISPVCSPEPTAEGLSSIGDQCDNPFLRESLVLESPATAAAKQQQQQHWQMQVGPPGNDNSSSSTVIGQHPGVSKAVVDDIAATWLAGKSVAPAAAAAATAEGRTFRYNTSTSRAAKESDAVASAASAVRLGRAKGAAAGMHSSAAVLPGAALAGPALANAVAAAQNVDERIKRILMASRARTAVAKAAGGNRQQQQQCIDVLTGPAAADQGRSM